MNNSKPFVIGISGASCSGKTWLANMIKNKRPDITTIFTLDSYYKNASFVNSLNFRHDNPNAIDFTLALTDLKKLINGLPANIPLYDYVTHSVSGYKLQNATPIIIVEGLFVFYNEEFRNLFDLKIWVESNEDKLLERRIKRDIAERGDNYTEALERYLKDVKPAYCKYIQPCKIYSDIIVNSYEK